MIIATNQCGCPPKKQDPPCSPCCVSNQRKKSKPNVGCSSSKSVKSNPSRPKIQEPGCCPIKPPEPEKVQVCKIRSEIAERGLPYKVLEATINDNKLVIRTQKEPPKEEFDPPCDCTEDPRSKVIEEEKEQSQISENRTLTLFPQCPKNGEEGEIKQQTVEEEPRTRALEENPNIFRLRVKKKSKDGQNIDLEFRTPRPWSAKMIAKHEQALLQAVKSQESETKEDKDEDVKEKKAKKTKRRRRSRSRKKKDECGEILAKPPCGQILKRKSNNC